MESNKRPNPNDETSLVVKRARQDALVEHSNSNRSLIAQEDGVRRTSSLYSPIMLLTGHKEEVFCMKFSPDGNSVASGSHDKLIFLWRVHGECENYGVLKGHQNAVLDLHWNSESSRILSASADKTVAIWDAEAGVRIRKFCEHTGVVNACSLARRGPEIFVSASDDKSCKLWDSRSKASVHTFATKFPNLAITLSDASDQFFSGGIDNEIKVWDMRKHEVTYAMLGHEDSITGLKLSYDGSYLLSNAMDNLLRIWDVRPYAPANRCIKIFHGHQHNIEKNLLKCSWSPDGSKISCGSGDNLVYVWDSSSRRLLYKLPGHLGSVNEVDFHPKEPIIGSASSDKAVFLGEIEK